MSAAIKIRRIDWYADEWISGTCMLDAAERGVYVTICSMIYSHGGPVPRDKKLPGLCGCHGNAFNRIIKRLAELGKIIENGSEIDVKRCEKELENARKRLGNASENGRKHHPHSKENNKIGANLASTHARVFIQPSTIKKDSEANASAKFTPSDDPIVDPVKALWQRGLAQLEIGGVRGDQARKLVGKWRREFGDAAVMAAIAAAETDLVSEPVSFISACLAKSRSVNGGTNGGYPLTRGQRKLRDNLQAIADADRADIERSGGELDFGKLH